MIEPTGLVEDRRVQLAGQPGLHALVVGLSAYTHLPAAGQPTLPQHLKLTQVSGPALSAWRLTEALRALPAGSSWRRPLKTLRLLLLPDAADLGAAQPPPNGATLAPSFAHLRDAAWAWRDDANDHPDSIALFYFAGHGLQDADGETLMVLGDFGSGPGESFAGCAAVDNLFRGMQPSVQRQNLARTQFFFVDSCRLRPAALDQLQLGSAPLIFPTNLKPMELRTAAPKIFSAKDGAPALSTPGRPTFFGEALVNALTRGATVSVLHPDGQGRKVWPVTTLPLTKAIEVEYILAHRTPNLERDGLIADAPLVLLDGPPPVDVEVRVVTGNPAGNPHALSFREPSQRAAEILCPVLPPPRQIRLNAGIRHWELHDEHGAVLQSGHDVFTLETRTLDVQL